MSDATFDTNGDGVFTRVDGLWFDPEGKQVDSRRAVSRRAVAMLDAVEFYRARLRAFQPPEGTKAVLVSDILIERFTLAPSEPVTLQIRPLGYGDWMQFVATRHDCPESP